MQPAKWKFYDYLEGDNNPIQEWLDDLSEEGRLLFQSVLKNCSKTERTQDWAGFRRFLKGAPQSEHIWELEFRADKRQYRILGIFGKDERKQAVLLLGCFHKQSRYTPADAIETARKRAKKYRQGIGGSRERKIQTDF